MGDTACRKGLCCHERAIVHGGIGNPDHWIVTTGKEN